MTNRGLQEQIQEDIITYLEGLPSGWLWHGEEAQEKTDALCQIVVDNFKKLEDKPNESVERYQATQNFFNDTEGH